MRGKKRRVHINKGRLSSVLLVLLLIALILGAASCRQEEPADFVQIFVEGVLDTVYRGQYDEDFLTVMGLEDDASLREEHRLGLEAESRFFLRYFDVGAVDQQTSQALVDFYDRLYQLARYQVSPSTPGQEEGIYTVQVTVYPLAAVQDMVEQDLDAYLAAFQAGEAPGGLSLEEENGRYARGLMDLIEKQVREDGYLEAEMVILTVARDEADGLYRIRGKGMDDIDELILRY